DRRRAEKDCDREILARRKRNSRGQELSRAQFYQLLLVPHGRSQVARGFLIFPSAFVWFAHRAGGSFLSFVSPLCGVAFHRRNREKLITKAEMKKVPVFLS